MNINDLAPSQLLREIADELESLNGLMFRGTKPKTITSNMLRAYAATVAIDEPDGATIRQILDGNSEQPTFQPARSLSPVSSPCVSSIQGGSHSAGTAHGAFYSSGRSSKSFLANSRLPSDLSAKMTADKFRDGGNHV